MIAEEIEQVQTGAEDIVWDLSDLYPSSEDASFHQDITSLPARAQAFEERWRGRVALLAPEELSEAMKEYEAIYETFGRLGSFARLCWTTDTQNPQYGITLQQVQEGFTQTAAHLLFFDVEWSRLPEEHLAILDAPVLAHYSYRLSTMYKHRAHVLTEQEERILNEKSLTARTAWVRLYGEITGAMSFRYRGRIVGMEELQTRLRNSDRDKRKSAAESLSAGLQQHSHTLTYIFNTVLADCASNDRLRHYPTWISSRNQANEISDESVTALIASVTSRYDIVERFYRLKKNLLGLDTLYEWDRNASLAPESTAYSWEEARSFVVDTYTNFHPEMGAIAEAFFTQRWIHAAICPGKQPGAFSASTVPSVHPYVLMNYTGTQEDVEVLAHELGHGIHQYLSRGQGYFNASTPLTIAETASVFGEMLVFYKLLNGVKDEREKLFMIAGKVERIIATVFRQIALNRFEAAIHIARREQGELTTEQISNLWMQTQQPMYGNSVTLTDNYRSWWSYIGHFIRTPGYVYAYSFGELLVLALFNKYMEEPEGFTRKYYELLSSGGSDKPETLIQKVGVDLEDPAFWSNGLQSIEKLLVEAEELYKRIG